MHRRIVSLVLVILLTGLTSPSVRAQSPDWTPPPVTVLPSAPWRNPGLVLPAAPGGPAGDIDFIELHAVADTFVASSWGFKDTNFGADETLWFGTEEYLEHARTFLRFQLPAAVPGQFAGASLFLPIAGGNAPLPLTAHIHRLLWDWNESNLVWWNQPYTQYFTTFEVPAEPDWVPVDVTQLYLDWRSGKYPNHGVYIRGPESPARIAKGMFSRDAGPDAPQPTLVIFYVPDRVPPSCSMSGLPTPAPSPLHVSFFCDESGGSGMAGVEVQMREGDGPWRDAGRVDGNTAVFRADGLLGGHTYAFRIRGEDNAHNFSPWTAGDAAVTTIEKLPPDHYSAPMPEWLRPLEMPARIAEASQFSDPQPQSEPVRIERRFADEADGIWRTLGDLQAAQWLPGHRYRFRARATDNAGNATPWYSFGPVSIYSRSIQGRVLGPDGVPLPGVPLASTPSALNSPVTAPSGAFVAYYAGPGPATLSPASPDFELVGATSFAGTADVQDAEAYLYPVANAVQNGDFAAGLGKGWQVSGSVAAAVRTFGSTDLAARMGALPSQTFMEYDAGKQPCMAVGPDGITHLAWVDYGREWYANGKLYYATLPSGGGAWSEPQLLGQTAYYAYTSGSLACRIAIDSNNRVYLVSSAPSGPAIYDLRTRSAAGAWELAPAPRNSPIYSIAAREPNVLHVVFRDDCTGADCAVLGYPNIYYTTWRPGENWSVPRPIGRSETYSDYGVGVDLLLTADGARHAVWEWQPDRYGSQPSSTIRYSGSLDGLAWSWPRDITPPYDDAYGAVLRVDNAGQLYAFWNAFANSKNSWDMLYARRDGNAWSAPRRLGRPASAPEVNAAPGDKVGYYHDIAMSPDGRWWHLAGDLAGLAVYTGSSLDSLTERYRLENSKDYLVLAAAPHAMLVLDRRQNYASGNTLMRITQLPYTSTTASARVAQTLRVPDGPATPYLYYSGLLERTDGTQTDAELNVLVGPLGGPLERIGNLPGVSSGGMAPYFWSLESWRGQEIQVAFEFNPLGDNDALAWIDNVYVTHSPINLALSLRTASVRPASGTDMVVHVELRNNLDLSLEAPLELTWPAAWTLKDSTLPPASAGSGRALFLVSPSGVSTHAFDVTLSIPTAAAPAVGTVQVRLDEGVATRDYTPGDNVSFLRVIPDGQAIRMPLLYR